MAAFDWTNYLLIARQLAEQSADDAALRSAVSRAYYAAYNSALNYCNGNSILIVKNKGSHEDLWDAFLSQNSLQLLSVQAKGDRLRKRRTDADYKPNVSGWGSTAEQSLQDSHDILKALGYNPPPP